MEEPVPSARATDPIGPDHLRRVADGDHEAFAELYDAFAGPLHAVAFRILNDSGEAEDVLQAVFFFIWDDAARYDPARGTPFTWAYTITRSKALDRHRLRQRRAQLMDAGGMQELVAATPVLAAGADEELERNERAGLVRSALARLPGDQREVIELAFFGGLTQNEIAARLHEPLGTIKARIRRGMIKLRTRLSGRVEVT